MPADKTTITELVTGLATLGHPTIDDALSARPRQMVSVSPELWQRLGELRSGRAHDLAFEAAWVNGVAFLKADDGLRGRRPKVVEWRGGATAIDDELVPIDLRIDRVFLVSCKYLSKVIANVAPARLFDGLLRVRTPAEQLSWFAAVAPAEYSSLLAAAMRHAGLSGELSPVDRRRLRTALHGARWPDSCTDAWDDLVDRVATSSAARWRSAIKNPTDALRLFWRLVRIGPAPYFILGVSDARPLRLGVVTTWDWQQRFDLADLNVVARPAGQPVVDWVAVIRDRRSRRTSEIAGHVEIRWSHGRFNGSPEAKVYLDSSHDNVPGYTQLR